VSGVLRPTRHIIGRFGIETVLLGLLVFRPRRWLLMVRVVRLT